MTIINKPLIISKERIKLLRQREELPIRKNSQQIIELIKQNNSIVIVGETGSGKTTQIPQLLLENKLSNKRIAVTQPRRVAAITIAERVSKEIGCTIGTTIGYRVRFDEKISKETTIEYLTDGMLLRTALLDKELSKYDIIILDEAHERTIHTDILIGLLKDIQSKRDIKIIIMSATLESDLFSKFFNAPVINITGRQYPIEIYHLDSDDESPLDNVTTAILQIHVNENEGDILVFLPGQDTIESTENSLIERMKKAPITVKKLKIFPLYAALPPEQQLKIFEPIQEDERKVILSTNIAETSVTIPGIKYVIDTGLVKEKEYQNKIGMECLKIQSISKAQAMQRTGRAGRETAGKSYRLYTLKKFEQFNQTTIPEIQRCSLDNIILQLKAIGIIDIKNFKFLEPPPLESITRSELSLERLGALENNKITEVGKVMVTLPITPSFSKTIIYSIQNKCLIQVLCIISMLSVDTQFFVNLPHLRQKVSESMRMFSSDNGDHFMLLNIFLAFKKVGIKKRKLWCIEHALNFKSLNIAINIFDQLYEYVLLIVNNNIFKGVEIQYNSKNYKKYMEETITNEMVITIKKSFLYGFPDNIAIRQPDSSYITCPTNKTVFIHPSSSLLNLKIKYILFSEMIYTTKPFIRSLLALDENLIMECYPQLLSD